MLESERTGVASVHTRGGVDLVQLLDGKSVFCVFGLRLDTCVFVCICLLATRGDALLTDSRHARSRAAPADGRETLRDGRGGRHIDLAAPHPATPPQCTGLGRPRRSPSHRWAGPAAPLRPPRPTGGPPALRPAPEICARSFPLPAAYLGVYLVCICSEAGYARICAYLMPSPCVFPI